MLWWQASTVEGHLPRWTIETAPFIGTGLVLAIVKDLSSVELCTLNVVVVLGSMARERNVSHHTCASTWC